MMLADTQSDFRSFSSETLENFEATTITPRKPRYVSTAQRRFITTVVVGSFAAAFVTGADETAWAIDQDGEHWSVEAPGGVEAKSLLSNEIKGFGSLDQGWDDADSVVPSDAGVADALAFIDLLPLDAILPKTTVSSDGEIGFYWKTDRSYIDIGFLGDGKISYFAKVLDESGAPFEVHDEAEFLRRSLPKDLIDAIALV